MTLPNLTLLYDGPWPGAGGCRSRQWIYALDEQRGLSAISVQPLHDPDIVECAVVRFDEDPTGRVPLQLHQLSHLRLREEDLPDFPVGTRFRLIDLPATVAQLRQQLTSSTTS